MRLPVRRISPGHAEGIALVSPAPFSFVGGVEPESGVIQDESGGCRGENLAGRVFAFPTGKGSTVGSYVLYGMAKRGTAPVALVNERAEAITAVGAILGNVPMVDGVDLGAFLPGDHVLVDADRAEVDLPGVEARPVVSAILRNRGRVLVVRRSPRVGSFQDHWSGVSGYLEGDEEPKDRARMEILEETGIRGVRFRVAGAPVITRHGSTAFVVHPLLFDAPTRSVQLDWENVEYRWIVPADLASLRTVPRLADVFSRVLDAT